MLISFHVLTVVKFVELHSNCRSWTVLAKRWRETRTNNVANAAAATGGDSQQVMRGVATVEVVEGHRDVLPEDLPLGDALSVRVEVQDDLQAVAGRDQDRAVEPPALVQRDQPGKDLLLASDG